MHSLFYQLPITKWPRQSGAPVGAAPPTRSQLRLQRHTQVFWSCGQSATFAYFIWQLGVMRRKVMRPLHSLIPSLAPSRAPTLWGHFVVCNLSSIHLSPRPRAPRLQHFPSGQIGARPCSAYFALSYCHSSIVARSVDSFTVVLIVHLHYKCINHLFTHCVSGSPCPQFRLAREPCMPYTLGSPPITHGCHSLAFTHISSLIPGPITEFPAAAL